MLRKEALTAVPDSMERFLRKLRYIQEADNKTKEQERHTHNLIPLPTVEEFEDLLYSVRMLQTLQPEQLHHGYWGSPGIG